MDFQLHGHTISHDVGGLTTWISLTESQWKDEIVTN